MYALNNYPMKNCAKLNLLGVDSFLNNFDLSCFQESNFKFQRAM